jgi:hypothetical protein
MSTLEKYDNLLKFMYDEFNEGRNASGHGEHIQVLISHFESRSEDNRLGNVYAKEGAVRHFIRNGLIAAVDVQGSIITRARDAYRYGRMQPTTKGQKYLQEKRMGVANAVASVSGTFFGKFIKSILGK